MLSQCSVEWPQAVNLGLKLAELGGRMDFDLTEEQRMFWQAIADFCDHEIAPLVDEAERKEEFPYPLFRKLGDLGFLCCRYPEEYGGAGADKICECLYMEETNRVCAGIASSLIAQATLATSPIFDFGSEAQKQRYLVPAIKGEKVGCFALTEPNAGSDAASITTRAIKDGDQYVINGRKIFITNGSMADYCIVAAYTDPKQRGKGISLFLVDRGTPGFEVTRKLEKAGLRAADTTEIVFEDCRVHRDQLVGGVEGGFSQVVKTLVGGRISYGGRSAGMARAAFDLARKYAAERSQFGKPIGKFQVIQFRLAEMAMGIDIMHTITWKTAWMYDQKRACTKEASYVKLYSSETAQKIILDAIQIFGGHGFMMEYPIQRIWRDSRVLSISEGTSEIQHLIIASELQL
jgi:alkylation response protein AidB-like acyl-CoA dehydrogenase